jgi:flavin reductase (DIM6/NTAB) family NADH-FMN oxidoreductase RutF
MARKAVHASRLRTLTGAPSCVVPPRHCARQPSIPTTFRTPGRPFGLVDTDDDEISQLALASEIAPTSRSASHERLRRERHPTEGLSPTMAASNIPAEPPILYWGTPVVLNSTENPNSTFNLAPISSAFWLGWRCMLGIEATSQTAQNLMRTGEIVINLVDHSQVNVVNKLSMLTGSDPVPTGKAQRGYHFEEDKFGVAGLTPVPSETVRPPRALECPVQMEAELVQTVRAMADDYDYSQHERAAGCTLNGVLCFEVRIKRVHVDPAILVPGKQNRVDPNAWRPLIMSFSHYYGLGPELVESKLAGIPESQYRSPDIDRAQEELAAALEERLQVS